MFLFVLCLPFEKGMDHHLKKKELGNCVFFLQNSLLSSLGKGCGHTIFPRIVESLK